MKNLSSFHLYLQLRKMSLYASDTVVCCNKCQIGILLYHNCVDLDENNRGLLENNRQLFWNNQLLMEINRIE